MIDFGLNPEQEAHAKALHNELIVIDMLTESSFPDGLFEDMQSGGLTCGSFTIGAAGLDHFMGDSPALLREWWSWDATIRDLGLWQGIFNDGDNTVRHIC